MGIKRLTFEYEAGKSGWSESFLFDGSYENAFKLGSDYGKLRMALCGYTVLNTYLRVSDEDVGGDAQVSATPYIVANPDLLDTDGKLKIDTGAIPVRPAMAAEADRPYSAILVRMEGGAQSHRMMYLRGVPDSIIRQGQYPLYPQSWRDAFDAWAAFVRANFKFRGQVSDDTTKAGTINGVSFNATTGEWQLVALGNGLVNGQKIRVVGIKGAFPSRINGTWTARKSDEASAEIGLAGSVGNKNFIYQKGGLVYKIQPVNLTITNVLIRGCVSKRTGRPFDSPRGRRKSRK